jgi:hypothetical protein
MLVSTISGASMRFLLFLDRQQEKVGFGWRDNVSAKATNLSGESESWPPKRKSSRYGAEGNYKNQRLSATNPPEQQS